MTKIVELIAETLRLPIDGVERAISLAPYRTKKYVIPKRSGGQRVILQPSSQIKPVLYWLQARVFDYLPVHPIATAFREGVSILENASTHKHSLYSVRLDVADFFPSIRPLDAWAAIIRSSEMLPAWAVTAEAFDIISKSCFDRSDQLPIGYATSPSIANAVMFPIDVQLAKLMEGLHNLPVGTGHATLTP